MIEHMLTILNNLHEIEMSVIIKMPGLDADSLLDAHKFIQESKVAHQKPDHVMILRKSAAWCKDVEASEPKSKRFRTQDTMAQ